MLRDRLASLGLGLVARYGRWPDGACPGERATRAVMFDAILASREFARVVVPLVRLYLAYFRRPPDHDGLAHWLQCYHEGASLQQIAHAFAQSPEFARRCACLADDAFVLQVFRAMLGRDPGAGGRAPWVRDLREGRITRGDLVEAFSHSPDFHAHVAADVYAAVMYLFMLRRTPDPAGFAYWIEARRAGSLPVERLVRSDEFRERWLSTAVKD